jgi:hypothetical protein
VTAWLLDASAIAAGVAVGLLLAVGVLAAVCWAHGALQEWDSRRFPGTGRRTLGVLLRRAWTGRA